ncbi:hypothetical protein HOLleu_38969 [Holothuria leucospilota]|uniref:Uncharacterized protein n=1 Tax=Holothuria leucospilota TaxID=206669 RepID=A0A9Q1BDS5_HOLLE|nr:hypothetical protein HOLleu_38969 [Holothuria leucospilota]
MPPISTSSDVTDYITTVGLQSFEEEINFNSEFATSPFWGTTSQNLLISVTSGDITEDDSKGKPTEANGKENLSPATVLLFSLSFIIGCFALTALILRIGSRLKKAKMEAQEKRRNRRLTMHNNIKPESTTQRHKKLTIRMHAGQDSVKKGNQTRKSSSKDSQGLKVAATALHDRRSASYHKNERKKKASIKTNKTLEALIEIGAFPQDIALYSLSGPDDSRKDGQPSRRYSTTKQAELTNLSNEGAAYTNEAFDLNNPDELQSRYSLEERDKALTRGSFDMAQSSFSTSEANYDGHGVFNLPDLSKDGMSSVMRLVENEKDLSEGSSMKENDVMLDHSMYSTASTSGSEGSPVTARKYLPMKYLKHYDKNRNNSRDSGYVESLTSQDSMKKRKLGIVEPFYHRAFLEDQIGSRIHGGDDILISQCPTCQTLTPQKQTPRHRKGSMASNDSEDTLLKISPFRNSANVPAHYPYSHRLLGKRASYAMVYPSRAFRAHSFTRSHSVVSENADYNMKCSLHPSRRYLKRLDSATQTDGAPLHRKSTVRWKKEGGNFILTPMENNEIDHLGPIYLSSET